MGAFMSSSKGASHFKSGNKLSSDDYITIGSSGGFTGGGSEICLYGNGLIAYREWATAGATLITKKTGKIDMEATANMFQLFTSSVLKTEHRKVLNMTTYITYHKNNVVHNWYFPYGSPPLFLETIYDTFMEITREDMFI